jgi:hypothetical protein
VDHDPVVVAHARALLADHSRTGHSKVTAVERTCATPGTCSQCARSATRSTFPCPSPCS